ncbi:MAG: MOSC N-terminal beta barrel domain-containing protein [Pseudomonadota bacterium]
MPQEKAKSLGIVSSLHRFIVKSTAGEALQRASIETRGIVGDRRFMVVDQNNRFVTGRLLPKLTQLHCSLDASLLTLSMANERLEVPVPQHGANEREVVVWRDTVTAFDTGDMVSEWLSSQFGRSLRLVYQHDDHHRFLPEHKRTQDNDEVSFADGYPMLLIGSASLQALNDRLASPVTMSHFRPNIVVETEEPFIEDTWSSIAIGEVVINVASRCSRCIFTTVDPATGLRDEHREPLETLRSFRTDDASGEIMFGVNVCAATQGDINVGDVVTAHHA